jgi:peptidoglycan/xylan/chitin deacetylase (PgdA/CDA1 family)
METTVRQKFVRTYCIIYRHSLDGCIYDPDEAKRVLYAYQKGHQVASHTWSHSDLTTLTWDQSELVVPYH